MPELYSITYSSAFNIMKPHLRIQKLFDLGISSYISRLVSVHNGSKTSTISHKHWLITRLCCECCVIHSLYKWTCVKFKQLC